MSHSRAVYSTRIPSCSQCDPCDEDFTATKVLLAFAAIVLVGGTVLFIVVTVCHPEESTEPTALYLR